jgi:hypothetical protein
MPQSKKPRKKRDAGASAQIDHEVSNPERGAKGASAKALVTEAMVSNRHVPAVLAGAAKPKKRDDGYITMGRDEEAAYYAEQWGEVWRETPGAIAWLWATAGAGGVAKPVD